MEDGISSLAQKYVGQIRLERISFEEDSENRDLLLHIPKEMVKEYLRMKNDVRLTYQNCANSFHRETRLLEVLVASNPEKFPGKDFLNKRNRFDALLQETSTKNNYYEFYAIEILK